MASPINYKKSVNSTCLQLKEEEALFVMHKFETFDCGLIKGQSFSEYECDLTFIFVNTYREEFILIKIIKNYDFAAVPFFLRPVIHGVISIVAVEFFLLKFGFKLKL